MHIVQLYLLLIVTIIVIFISHRHGIEMLLFISDYCVF